MDDQRAPKLEAMDEQEATRLLTELTSDLSPEEEYRIRHPEDYLMEMPQLGERIRGRQNIRAFQDAFPYHSTPPSIRIRRVLVRDGLWVVESVTDYGGEQLFHGAAILESKGDKIWRDTRYFAAPFEAPRWRAQWVERMQT